MIPFSQNQAHKDENEKVLGNNVEGGRIASGPAQPAWPILQNYNFCSSDSDDTTWNWGNRSRALSQIKNQNPMNVIFSFLKCLAFSVQRKRWMYKERDLSYSGHK